MALGNGYRRIDGDPTYSPRGSRLVEGRWRAPVVFIKRRTRPIEVAGGLGAGGTVAVTLAGERGRVRVSTWLPGKQPGAARTLARDHEYGVVPVVAWSAFHRRSSSNHARVSWKR
ncbi:MAG: hypothetical protein ACRDO4_16335 [Nocardioides sp.]